MVIKDMSLTGFFMKVWNCEILPKLSSSVNKLLSPVGDQTDKFLNSSQYEPCLKELETDGTCPQIKTIYHEPKSQGKERNDDSHRVVHEKSYGNEEMSNIVEKNQKFPHPGLKVKPKRKDSMYNASAAICVLLMCLPPSQGTALRNTSMSLCQSYVSNLSDSSGPWNHSTCSSELEKIRCSKGEIRRCVRFVFRDYLFAACIKDLKGYDLKDDECVLVTQTGGSNKKVAQCYEGIEYCSPPAATSTPTYLNITKPSGGFNWTTFIIVLFVAVVCIAIIPFVCYIVPLCIGRFWIRHYIYNHVRSC